jgi:hypothetical protein
MTAWIGGLSSGPDGQRRVSLGEGQADLSQPSRLSSRVKRGICAPQRALPADATHPTWRLSSDTDRGEKLDNHRKAAQ